MSSVCWESLHDNSAFEIGDVVPDSPLSKAGVKVGERILKADHVAASVLRVTALRERPQREPGTKIALEV